MPELLVFKLPVTFYDFAHHLLHDGCEGQALCQWDILAKTFYYLAWEYIIKIIRFVFMTKNYK